MTTRTTRSEKLDLRLSAEETLADRRSFQLDAERWAAFSVALDAPTRDLPRLKRLLNEPGIFYGREPA